MQNTGTVQRRQRHVEDPALRRREPDPPAPDRHRLQRAELQQRALHRGELLDVGHDLRPLVAVDDERDGVQRGALGEEIEQARHVLPELVVGDQGVAAQPVVELEGEREAL